jgi:hypothetical protein
MIVCCPKCSCPITGQHYDESCVDAAIKEVLDNERDDEAFEYAQFIANEIRKRLVQ